LRGARARTADWVAGAALVAACAALALFVMSNGYYRASGVTKEFGTGVFETNFPIHAVEFVEQIGFLRSSTTISPRAVT
jgi:hypothetical protein